jgi:pseudaminic acid synthase
MLGKKNKPFFIAEISSNHNGSLNNAKKLILSAHQNGASAVKLQTYTPRSMTINCKKKYFKINHGLWKGYNLWNLYKKAYTPYVWHKVLFNYGKKIGIKVFSTPFDEKAVDLLEKLNCPFYKLASFEMTDIPLIKKIASTKKHMIISTGMANINEISLSFNTALKFGAKNVTLLYCVSNYPSKISDFNLNNIKILKKRFKCEIGFSDHSTDSRVAAAAVAAGATVVEKHISLKNIESLDSKFSIEGNDILKFKKEIYNQNRIKKNSSFYKKLLGKKNFFRNKSEDKSKKFRRSIFVVKDLKKGDIFSKENIRKIRPGYGLSPIYYEKIIGAKCNSNIKYGEPLSKKYFKI